jgi:parallel beta-helix repeat protein
MQLLLAAWLAAVVALGAPAPAAGGRTVMGGHPRTLHVAAHAAAPEDGSAASPYPRIGQALAVAVAGDTVLVGPGRYAEEVRTVRPGRPGAPMGVWLSSDARGTAVMDNSIEANVLDGVHLAGSRVGLVRGNTIRANRKAAFSVAFKGSARPFLTENRVAGNPARERVRVDGHPKPTG